MFCAQCHNPNAADNKFCAECGVPLTAATTVAGSPEIVQLVSQAFTLLEHGDRVQAHASVDAALALDPNNTSAHSVRSILFEREGKIADAIRELEWVVARNPQSGIDRAKLEALRGNPTTSFPRKKRWTSQQIGIASAVTAGLVVFGGGLAAINQPSPSRSEGTRGQGATLQPASATLPPATKTPVPIGLRPLPTLPNPPAPLASNLAGPPVPSPPRAALGNPATPVFTAPGRQPLLRPSAPIGPLGMPQMSANGGKTGGTGLAPAAIGEVVPLPQAPALAPGGPSVAAATLPPGTVPGAVSGAVTPGAPTQTPETPKAAEATEQKPRLEPLEPETGFIKIEPLKGAGESKGATPGVAKAAPPSISVNIASSGGDEAAIAEAQRAQRNAFSAARVANLEDAERHYRQAASLYELLVKRGGSSARQAREGLDACRKALAALR